MLVGVLLKQVRRPSIWHEPCPWPLALVNIYGELLLWRWQLGWDLSSWLFSGDSPPHATADLEECSLVTDASKPTPQLWTLPVLPFAPRNFPLAMVCCMMLLRCCIYKEGMSSASSQLLCKCAAQGQSSALCADGCSGQVPVNKWPLFFLSGKKSEMKSVVGRNQYLVKLSLHLILSTASLWRTEGTFCYSASWFPSTGANLPFYMIWHIPFCAVITIKFKYR